MGLFDFLKKSSPPPGADKSDRPVSKEAKKIQSLAKVATDKRAQAYDRGDAIRALSDMGSLEAAEALIKRFSFTVDPSISDQEEKEMAFNAVVAVGEGIVPVVRSFCEKAEVLTWPLRVLEKVLDAEAFKQELLTLAERQGTEYARNVEPKLQLLGALGKLRAEDAREAVERFLEDVNENVRFSAVLAVFEQRSDKSIPALVTLMGEEESVRVKNKVCDGFISAAWTLTAEQAGRVRKAMEDMDDFRLDEQGRFVRSGGFQIQ